MMFRMTAKPKRSPEQDEAQSRRFIDLVHELEEKGELDTSEDGQALDRLVRNAVAPGSGKRFDVRRVTALILCICWNAPAYAQPSNVIGPGTAPCGTWTEQRTHTPDGPTTMVLESWA
jgi:hypothetical protein